MLVTVIPNVKQIERYAESARSGFDTLDIDDAIANAKDELDTLLAYLGRLDAAKDAVCESFVSGVESRVILEMVVSDFQSGNLA